METVYKKNRSVVEWLDGVDCISLLSDSDLNEFKNSLKNYFILYLSKLGFSSEESFAIAYDIEQLKGGLIEQAEIPININKAILTGNWDLEKLKGINISGVVQKGGWDVQKLPRLNVIDDGKISSFGMRVLSPRLTDTSLAWDNIRNVCDMVSKSGTIGSKCFSSVYVGAEILGDNALYWYRFIKLITIYENVIYRFMYGEQVSPESSILKHGKAGAGFYESKLNEIRDTRDGVHGILNILNCGNDLTSDVLRQYGISFWNMLLDDDWQPYENFSSFQKHCAVEFKGNPTTEPIILQNNVDFVIRLMLYCKSPDFDEDILDKRRKKLPEVLGNIESYAAEQFEQAAELCDMICGDDTEAKVRILRQYLGSFEETRDSKKMVRGISHSVVSH